LANKKSGTEYRPIIFFISDLQPEGIVEDCGSQGGAKSVGLLTLSNPEVGLISR